MIIHDRQTCSQPIPVLPVPSWVMVAWVRLDAFACGLLRRLGLLRAWYAVARLALAACPPLARLVAPLRPVVLEPSLTGGPDPLPVAGHGDRVVLLERGMVFGGDIHDGDRCNHVPAGSDMLPAPRLRTRVRRSVVLDGRCVHTVTIGWRVVRWGR